MDLALLDSTLQELGQPAYRARQVWSWAARGAAGYGDMTDLPAALRAQLEERVPFSTLTVGHESHSRDGTVKALFHTHDGRPVEAVLMRYRDGRRSLCLSSQSGCPLTCTFCATGSMKFGRNLTVAEILDQALHFRRVEDVDHVVFMGMGEPGHNIGAVLRACDLLPDAGISHRRTTVSTVGWIPAIERLAADPKPLRLALSVHAADDALRSQLMPVNERYPLAEVLQACRRFYAVKRRRIFVEYVMLAGVNDRYEQAVQLARVLDAKIFKVNLIPYNPTRSVDEMYEGSSREAIAAFKAVLEEHGVRATVRLTRGRDIDAACGQLAATRDGRNRELFAVSSISSRGHRSVRVAPVAGIDMANASSEEVYEAIATMDGEAFEDLMAEPASRQRVIDALADHMAGLFRPDKAGDLEATIHMKLWDKPGGGYDHFELRIAHGTCTVVQEPETEPDLTIKVRPGDLRDLITGRSGPKRLAFKGRLRAIGDIRLGMRLPDLFAFDEG